MQQSYQLHIFYAYSIEKKDKKKVNNFLCPRVNSRGAARHLLPIVKLLINLRMIRYEPRSGK